MTPTHINPGTDTTINPVVIDDSYREKNPEYDPIFIGLINYFKEIQWQRVESEISITEIIEILTDFAKMESEEKASRTSAPSHPLGAQQRNEYKFDSTELLLLAHDEWKRREERKHNHPEQDWAAGFLNGFLTDKKWAREHIDALLQAGDPK